MQTCLKEQGLKQTCTIKPRVSYKHDQVVFLDYFSFDLDIYSWTWPSIANVVLHLFLRIFVESWIITTIQYGNQLGKLCKLASKKSPPKLA